MAAVNSGGEQGQVFELDIGLYRQDANENLIGNGNSQASPINNAANFSNEIGELGSSCGSTAQPLLNQVNSNMTLTISPSPSNPLLENPQLNSPSSEEPESSTPQSRPPAKEENQIVPVGNYQPDQSDSKLRSNNRGLLENETMIHVTTDVNAPSMERVEVEAPNFGTALIEPPQPYFPKQFEQAEMVVQNNVLIQSFPPQHGPQSALQADLFQPQMAAPISQNNPFYGDQFRRKLGEQQAHFYPHPYPQTTMGIVDGRSSWTNQQLPWFSVTHNNPYRPMTSTPSGTRCNQFMGANVFGSPSSNFMPNGPCSLQSRPVQPTIWHQVPAMSNTLDPYYQYPNYSLAPAPSVYPRLQSLSYQYNHQVSAAPNFYDTEGWNTMLPLDPSFQIRPRNFAPHQVQVPCGMNQYFNSMLPGPSMPSRFQQFNSYNQHFNPVNYGMPNVSDAQNYNSRQQEPLLLAGPAQATNIQQQNPQPQFSVVPEPTNRMGSFGPQNPHVYQAELQQDLMTGTSVTNSQPSYSLQPAGSSMLNHTQRLMDGGQVNESIYAMPQSADPHQDTSIVSGSSTTSRPRTSQLQEQLKIQQPQISISEAQDQKKRVTGRRSRRRSRFELGESSSSSSKRIKRESTTTETRPLAPSPQRVDRNTSGDAQENEGTSRVPNIRAIKNEIYDPLFEEIGLPIDPHLRMFALN